MSRPALWIQHLLQRTMKRGKELWRVQSRGPLVEQRKSWEGEEVMLEAVELMGERGSGMVSKLWERQP